MSNHELCRFSPAGSRGETQAERAAEDSKAAGRASHHHLSEETHANP